jgi:hypothetical protein
VPTCAVGFDVLLVDGVYGLSEFRFFRHYLVDSRFASSFVSAFRRDAFTKAPEPGQSREQPERLDIFVDTAGHIPREHVLRVSSRFLYLLPSPSNGLVASSPSSLVPIQLSKLSLLRG